MITGLLKYPAKSFQESEILGHKLAANDLKRFVSSFEDKKQASPELQMFLLFILVGSKTGGSLLLRWLRIDMLLPVLE